MNSLTDTITFYNYLLKFGTVMTENHYQSSVEAGLIPLIANPDCSKVEEAQVAIQYLLEILAHLIMEQRTQYIHADLLERVYSYYKVNLVAVSDQRIVEDTQVVIFKDQQYI
mmetsp:Transcript_44090/g.32095  ORF Transcript_44090/g.32095 Transcript_44090/m.32095 type:complete len:112 (+) Transcript_44090:1081-1416(+)